MRAPKKVLGAIAGISMLATALGIGSAALAASPTYYDVYDLTTLAQAAANGLFRAGIMRGTAQGEFSPNGIVTRAQAVRFVVNLVGVQLQYPRTPSYKDVRMGSQYYPYVETALQDGYLVGFAGSSGRFDPSTPVTRIQLAILIINAMGDQGVAQSLAGDTALYRQFADLGKVPSGDLGYANAGMKFGFTPPLYAKKRAIVYAPNGQVDREELAVGLWRAYKALKAATPASASLAPRPRTVGVHEATRVAVTLKTKAGKVLTRSQLGIYTISYSVASARPSSATVSANGLFVASAVGTYTVQASITGGLLKAPVTASTTVGVYGRPTALVVAPAGASVVADGSARDTVTVSAVDANGTTVGDLSGKVTVDLSGSGVTAPSSGQPAGVSVAGNVVTVRLRGGTGSFSVRGLEAGQSSTLKAVGADATDADLAEGTAGISAVEPTLTRLGLAVAPSAPRSLSVNRTTFTTLTVSGEDAGGHAWSSEPGTDANLTLTGPGSFGRGATPVTRETVYIPVSGSVPVRLYGLHGRPGTITVRAKSSGLKGARISVPAYVNTAPASLRVTSTTGRDGANRVYTLYAVQLLDTNGHPITSSAASDAITVRTNAGARRGGVGIGTLSGATFRSVTIENAMSSPVYTSALQNGRAEFAIETTTVGTSPVTVRVDDTTNRLAARSTYRFAVGPAAELAISPKAGNYFVLKSGEPITFRAQVDDGRTNAVHGAGVPVTFSFVAGRDGGGLAFPNGSSAAGTNSYTVDTNASGVATVSFTVPAASPGGGLEVAVASSGLRGAKSADVDVLPGTSTARYATQVVLSPTNATYTVGSGSLPSITATAENAVGTSVGLGPDTLRITSSNRHIVAVRTEDESSVRGVLSKLQKDLTVEGQGTAVITVKDISNTEGPSAAFRLSVRPGSASELAVEYKGAPIGANNNVTAVAGTPIAVQVVNADSLGDPVPVLGSTALTVNLGLGKGATGEFRATSTGARITKVHIEPGQSRVTVYFDPAADETLTTGSLTATR